ncbi:speckle-type POZ protein-like [Microtus oregoni]|uniref:speckle-type POZ protein-like n=1 Tax=Microtus oregoni TaxID=111838 RepID=UPI001BB142BD|nr:speckle-type POZ protein-like [Microtus oregoni]
MIGFICNQKEPDLHSMSDAVLSIAAKLKKKTIPFFSGFTVPAVDTSEDLAAESRGYTQITVKRFSYRWTISNFSFCLEGNLGNDIASPTFSPGANDKYKWIMKLYLNGTKEESRGYLSVFLVLCSSPKSSVWGKFQFGIINAKGEEFQIMNNQSVLRFNQNEGWGITKFILRDFLFSTRCLLLPDDKLTLYCEVSVVQYEISISEQNMQPVIDIPRCTLVDNLGELWENSCFTDCCLVVKDQEFRAHKAILTARSPVFRAMFEHDMEESRMNHIEIHDLKPEVFKAMMNFIYTGKEPVLHSMADAVLAAADKYGLERLKVMCESALCRDLSVENAAYTHFLVDLHSSVQLKSRAMDFVTSHASEVLQTSSWMTVVDSYPNLVAKVSASLFPAHGLFLEPPSNA